VFDETVYVQIFMGAATLATARAAGRAAARCDLVTF
jgi:hypothetical protein